MVYTEIKNRNSRIYYYRVMSVRKGEKISKKREYLGVNLSKSDLKRAEEKADKNILKERNEKINKEIKKIKSKIVPMLRKNKIKRAGIFGSYVRGEQKKNSDIDILIKPSKSMGLEFVRIAFELEDKLGRKVDLVTYKSIHPLLKKRILSEEVRIIWIKTHLYF